MGSDSFSIKFSLYWDNCPSFTFLWYILIYCCFGNLKPHIQKVQHYNTISHQFITSIRHHVLLSLDRHQQSGGELSGLSDQSHAQNGDDINCKWSPALWGHRVDKWHCSVLAEFPSWAFLQNLQLLRAKYSFCFTNQLLKRLKGWPGQTEDRRLSEKEPLCVILIWNCDQVCAGW